MPVAPEPIEGSDEASGSVDPVHASVSPDAFPGPALMELVVLPPAGESAGEPFSVRCPAGTVATGVDGAAGALLDSVVLVCGLAEGRGEAGAAPLPLDRVGGEGGQPYSARCAPGGAIVGMQGGAGALIDGFSVGCLPLDAALDAHSVQQLDFGQHVGGGGGGRFEARCPPGSVVAGLEGTAGRLVHSVSLVCATPSGSDADPAAGTFVAAEPPQPTEPQMGRLGVASTPTGVVLVDGEEVVVGTYDQSIQIEAGRHEVQIRFPDGQLSEIKAVTVRPAVLTNVFFAQREP